MEASDGAADLAIQERHAFAAASQQNRSLDILQRYAPLTELEGKPSVSGGESDLHASMGGEQLADLFQVLSLVLVLGTDWIFFVGPKSVTDLHLIKVPVLGSVPPS